MSTAAERALALHLMFPRDYIALSRGFGGDWPSHKGIDMCWNSAHGGPNADVRAPGDGEVVALKDGMGNTWPQDKSNWGNYIKIKHADGVYTLMAHLLKGSLLVKIGQKVKQGQVIAKMNNSGASQGPHVHAEVYIGGAGTSYRQDPLKYLFAYPTDTVGDEHYNNGRAYKIQRYTPPQPVAYVGDPVARNPKVDQVRNDYTDLRARLTAGLKGEVAGYLNTGWYNVSGITTVDGYTWYNVGGYWAADTGAKFEYVPKDPDPIYSVFFPEVNEAQKDNLAKVASALNVKVEIKEK